ncbi:hypothetical protein [Flavobacterium mesophilum]|uniref:hypothetical protein n=1 Tax=Flavobacterium mesophilum TaxID=3143495 RepID=UPI0031CDD7D0
MKSSTTFKKSTFQYQMIKKSTYIRGFTKKQREQLEKVQQEEKIKTVPEILFFALDSHLEQKKEIERLNRIIEYKQRKIERLNLLQAT